MLRALTSSKARRRWAAAALGLALCLASPASIREPVPAPPALTFTLPTFPELFSATASAAQVLPPGATGPPVTTGCKGSPTSISGGRLGITVLSLSLFRADTGEEVVLLDAPKELDFALPSGTLAGIFASGQAPIGSYNRMTATMEQVFRIRCLVQCETNAAKPGLESWVTRGGSKSTDPDAEGTAADAITSNVSLVIQALDTAKLGVPFSLQVNASGNATSNITFSANGACELYDISPLLGQSLGTSYKVLAGSQSAEVQ